MASLLNTPGVNQADACHVLLCARVCRQRSPTNQPIGSSLRPTTHTGAHNIISHVKEYGLSIWVDQGGKGLGRTFANTSFSDGQRVCATSFAMSTDSYAKDLET